jgi:hypothetical protein
LSPAYQEKEGMGSTDGVVWSIGNLIDRWFICYLWLFLPIFTLVLAQTNPNKSRL